MKKFLLFTAALLMLGSCFEKPVDDPVAKDSIELSSNSATLTKEAGKVQVIVTSSGEWKLTSETSYDWVTPSAFKGIDGDIVKFDVVENVEEDRTAIYTFTCGKATADFTIISVAGEKPHLTLASEAELVKEFEAGKFTVNVNSPLGYRSVSVTLSEGADAWLHKEATLPGETENDALINFSYDLLEGLQGREAVITLSSEGLESLTVNLKQNAKPQLVPELEFVAAPVEGGSVSVPVTANVEYDVVIAEEGRGWLTYKGLVDGNVTFDITPLEGEKRSVVVTLTQKNVPAGTEALTSQFTITQVGVLIHWAADMNHNRLFPKWDGPKGAPSTKQNPCTVEALVYVNSFDNELNTIMGVEGKFLLRFGDAGKPRDVLQIATDGGYNFECYDYPFETKKWYHVAAVFDGNKVTVYRDGVKIGELSTFLYGVPLGNSWSYETWGSRCWWYGYSYDPNRSLNGMMTELRMWAKALTPEEINAENHFYTVDPNAEGLISYWKFTEGEGDTIADKGSNKQSSLLSPLYGELDVKTEASTRENKGTPGIKWVPVTLPNK